MLTKIAEFVERPGGEVWVGFLLILVSFGLWKAHMPKGEEGVAVGTTLIVRALCSSITVRKEKPEA